MKQTLISIAGAAIGGLIGYMAFVWVLGHGYYGMILPGGLLGIGAAFGRTKSIWVPTGCGAAAVVLSLFAEWKNLPFIKDDSLGYFVRHIFDLNSVHLVMIGVGGALAFWMPFRRAEEPK